MLTIVTNNKHTIILEVVEYKVDTYNSMKVTIFVPNKWEYNNDLIKKSLDEWSFPGMVMCRKAANDRNNSVTKPSTS